MRISIWAVWVATLSFFFSISYGFDICANPNIQTTPAISGTTVVWADSRLGIANIYCKYLDEPNDFALSSSNNPQVNPDIDGNIVVWVEDGDIFGYDLSTSECFNVCVDESVKDKPAVSRNKVVWQESDGNIYGIDLAGGSKSLICGAMGTQSNPDIDGDYVVWQDERSTNADIYGKIWGQTGEKLICTNGAHQRYPKISGLMVVWQDYRNSSATGTDIYGKHWNDTDDTPICTAANSQNSPKICGNIVAWKDQRNDSASDIYYCDLSVSGHPSVFLVGGSNTMTNPAVSNYTVIWENQTIEGGNIYGAFVLSSDTATLNITNPQAGQIMWNGKSFNIQWKADPNLIGVVNLEISVDGEQYRPITTNILNTGSYKWTPDEPVDSENCRIRAISVAGHSANVESGIFTIAQCRGNLTADFNGDCAVNLADFAAFSAQWLLCGNPYDDNCIK